MLDKCGAFWAIAGTGKKDQNPNVDKIAFRIDQKIRCRNGNRAGPRGRDRTRRVKRSACPVSTTRAPLSNSERRNLLDAARTLSTVVGHRAGCWRISCKVSD